MTDAASALALADTLKAQREGSPESPEMVDFPVFEADLRQLAASWAQDPMQAIGAFARGSGKGGALGWTADLRELRLRLLREHVAERVQAPELMKPPLNALPPEEAMRQFGRELFDTADWQRLHRLLTDGAAIFGQAQGALSEEVRAVRAFITGENFEKAEQFAEAVQAYRSVLTCIGDFVPVAPAAARLKELKKAHPKLFEDPRAASAPAGSGF